MKLADVKVGNRYACKVSGKMTSVKLLSIDGKGKQARLKATNDKTGREIYLRSARRLLYEV